MSKIANRRSPSGPRVSLQLPFYGCVPQSGTSDFAPLGSAGAAVALEQGQEYEIPLGNSLNGDSGRLDTFEVRNKPVGTDTQNVTYRVRKNGANVGDLLIIANNAVGPVKIDLSHIAVRSGDLVSISVDCPALIGTAPQARFFLSWVPQGNI
jgi:hypothetical protein